MRVQGRYRVQVKNDFSFPTACYCPLQISGEREKARGGLGVV